MKKLSIVLVLTLAVAMLALTACGAKKPADLKAKYEKNGYSVNLTEMDDDTAILTASKGITNTVTITWFANEDDAKKAEETAKNNNLLNTTIYRSGKMVAIGSEEAVKLAK